MAAILLASLLLFGADPDYRPPSISGAWALSEDLNGYMGIALNVKGDVFEYWFYSDVIASNEPEYPIRGKVVYRSNSIQLESRDKKLLYSTTWRLVVHEGEICLLADKDLPNHRPPEHPSDRLLHKIADTPIQEPVLNPKLPFK